MKFWISGVAPLLKSGQEFQEFLRSKAEISSDALFAHAALLQKCKAKPLFALRAAFAYFRLMRHFKLARLRGNFFEKRFCFLLILPR